MVAWIFSEAMLHYYIQLFTKSWWPNGQLSSNQQTRNDEDKLKTRGEARRQFLSNLPEVLTSLVGAQSAQRGATKVFDTLQNVNLNKQLFYVSFKKKKLLLYFSLNLRFFFVFRMFFLCSCTKYSPSWIKYQRTTKLTNK